MIVLVTVVVGFILRCDSKLGAAETVNGGQRHRGCECETNPRRILLGRTTSCLLDYTSSVY